MTRDRSVDSMASKELFLTCAFCLEYFSALVYDGARVREPNMISANDSLRKFGDSSHHLAFVDVTKLSARDEPDTGPACKSDPAITWENL